MPNFLLPLIGISAFFSVVVIVLLLRALQHHREKHNEILKQFAAHQQGQFGKLQDFILRQQDSLQARQDALRSEINAQIGRQNEHLHRELHHLSGITESRLGQIISQVNSRLEHGFTHNQDTFKDIITRLSKIDEAQKRLDKLAGDVTGLRDILNDKRSRGAFGESQLQTLVDNLFPAQHVRYQTVLDNGKRPDCLLLLPDPTGNIAIDAKFPLESYRALQDNAKATTQFHRDIKKHIDDIADKYICPPETAAGAMMFIPAEAVFAEIHARFTDLVEYAQYRNVWLASPTTLAAILTTAKAVIKDDATRRQAHVLREQLYLLQQDFTKFQNKMDSLARHIGQAQQDVSEVHRSARLITSRFQAIDEQR